MSDRNVMKEIPNRKHPVRSIHCWDDVWVEKAIPNPTIISIKL